jgi:hypothetical protein
MSASIRALFQHQCCVDTQNEENIDLVNSVYSIIKAAPIIRFIHGTVAGKNRMGREQEGEKERAMATY